MTLTAGYTLRRAAVQDAETIQAQRNAMFTDMGSNQDKLARARANSLVWHQRMLENGSYTGLLLEYSGEVIAGAGIYWQDLPPSPSSLPPTRAYVMNVYVAPEHRGKALARYLMEQLLRECRARQIEVVSLHASEAGRPTYEKLGFKRTEEMRLTLEVNV